MAIITIAEKRGYLNLLVEGFEDILRLLREGVELEPREICAFIKPLRDDDVDEYGDADNADDAHRDVRAVTRLAADEEVHKIGEPQPCENR